MKLALIYDPTDFKLGPESYSQNYRNMMRYLAERFEHVSYITTSCHADDVEADVMVYFDPHSSHNIEIEGYHNAIKYEYCNDPHQVDQVVQYPNGKVAHKLGAVERCHRFQQREINYVICPSRWGFERFLQPSLADGPELLWWPVSPAQPEMAIEPLTARWAEVLANGHCWAGKDEFKPYAFRAWSYGRPGVAWVPHAGDHPKVPIGNDYMKLLGRFVGGLALCDYYVVAKYLEVPLAGCVCLAQELPEYREMGFEDGINCLFVTKQNFDSTVRDVKTHPESYQVLADAGRHQALKWTADQFATYIYGHAHAVRTHRCRGLHCAETL